MAAGALAALEVLSPGPVPGTSRGEAHGELRREAIDERVEALKAELVERGGDDALASLERFTSPALDELEARCPQLAAEVAGIARGAHRSVAELVLLNLGDELLDRVGPPSVGGVPRGGTTALYVVGPAGPVLGVVLRDRTRQAGLFVLELPAEGARPATWVLCPPGELGLAGRTAAGLGVVTTHLPTTELGRGIPRGGLVRCLLESGSVAGARRLLSELPAAGGSFYMLADRDDYAGVEVSHERQVLTQLGPRTAHVHTDHAFDPVLRKAERVPVDSTTWRRMEVVSNRYVQLRPDDVASTVAFLDDVDADPRSQVLRPGQVPDAEQGRWRGALFVMELAGEGPSSLSTRRGGVLETATQE